MTDEEICAILDKMREEEPDHENCAMKDKLFEDLEKRIKSMKSDTVKSTIYIEENDNKTN